MSGGPSRRPTGITLVMIAGLLSLLGVTGALLVLAASQSAAAVRSAAGGRRAKLAAGSGLEYAAARLSRDPRIRHAPTSLDRGDDWAYREGVTAPIDRTLNPSYSHGEGWSDQAGGREGVYEPGLDDLSSAAWQDLDGDGRFSAWSGRVRGGGEGHGTFLLRVDAAEGRIPVNAPLDQQFGGYQTWLQIVAGNLGGILLEHGAAPGRVDYSSGTEIGRASRLGQHLIEGRPAAGYRTLDDVRTRLASKGYAPADIERILPHLSLGPYTLEAFPTAAGLTSFRSAPISMQAATREVLAAMWMYARVGTTGIPFDAEPGAWAGATCQRAGVPYSQMDLILFQDEAEGLADAVLDARKEGYFTWPGFASKIAEMHSEIFGEDLLDLAGLPRAQASWWTAKTKMAVGALSRDENPGSLPGALGGWGIDPDGNPANGIQSPSASAFQFAPGSFSSPTSLFNMALMCHGRLVTTDSPSIFEVAALGRSGPRTRSASWEEAGHFRASAPMALWSQRDFEDPDRSPALVREGIGIVDPWGPSGRRPVRPGSSGPAVVSLPVWNRYSGTGSAFHGGLGQIALAGSEQPGGDRYWPFREDFDGDPATDFLSEPDLLRIPAIPADARCVDAGSGFSFEAPWALEGSDIAAFSVEAWYALPADGILPTDPVFSLEETSNAMGPKSTVKITCNRVVPSGTVGTRFALTVKYGASTQSVSAIVPDVDPADPTRVQTGAFHLMATLKAVGAQTRMRLYVNGTLAPEALANFVLREANGPETLKLSRIDELRLYGSAPDDQDPGAAAAAYAAGRYVRPAAAKGNPTQNPVYLSPRFDLGPGARVLWGQWTEISHARLLDEVGIDVTAHLLDGSQTEIAAVSLEPHALNDLARHEGVRFLAYSVEFHQGASPSPAPLVDTPAFAEIRFRVLRPGWAPMWLGWEEQAREVRRSPPPPDDPTGGPASPDTDESAQGEAW